ncbi:MAG: bifunctional demethylmenaquinone methyltransferase/2-methoxy-6-polyprenyl-1,4-benzoquinol methylase UbiE [Tenacibaculum sp.]
MTKEIKPYGNSKLGKKEQVVKMFNSISDNYDKLNRVISLGIDMSWRKKVVKLVGREKPKQILDIATGTGDLALMMAKLKPDRIVGLDISSGMLQIARQKLDKAKLSNKIKLLIGDSENIPFTNNSFDAVTVAFGVRNFENLNNGLSEMHRVLKPGGKLVVLETSNPNKFPLKQGYKLYTNMILPLVGKVFSKDKGAYAYLSKSVNNFPFGKAFNNILLKNGFNNVNNLPVTFGVASIYTAFK